MEPWDEKQGPASVLYSQERLPPPLQAIKREPPALERVTENGDGSEHSEQEEHGEESSNESSDSGSSNTSTSSSATSSSTGSEAHARTQAVRAQHRDSGLFETDEYGEYLSVSCNYNEAKFYLSRFGRGSVGRCVLFKGRWITPNEFQAVSGRQSSKDWKRSIRLRGRCLKEYIGQGLFHEHAKSCICKICSGEDTEHRRQGVNWVLDLSNTVVELPILLLQEGEMALAAKRRRLSQADGITPSSQSQSASEPHSQASSVTDIPTVVEGKPEVGPPLTKKRRGRLPKNQRVWSPSGEVAQEFSSNDDEYKPTRPAGEEGPSSTNAVIDASDFMPRRSRRSTLKKFVGHRTELGTYTRKPKEWDAEEVAEFLRLQGFTDYADAFQEGEIDGESLFLLREHHLIERFNMKLGPTLKLLDTICRLRHPPLQ